MGFCSALRSSSFVLLVLFAVFTCLPAFADSARDPDEDHIQRAQEIYDDLAADLRVEFPKEEGKVWSQTKITLRPDWIVQGPTRLWGLKPEQIPHEMNCDDDDYRCDPVWKRQICETDSDCLTPTTQCTPLQASRSSMRQRVKKMCLGNTDGLIDRFYNIVVSADHELDIASLFIPSGRFYTAMINGLALASEKESVPAVRILYAGFPLFAPVIGQGPGGTLHKIVHDIREIAPDTYERLRINVGQDYSPVLTYNHTKIVLADGKRAMEGGHNLLDAHYLSTETIFDLSMEFRGPGVAKARDFLNVLWDDIGDRYHSFPKDAPRIPNFSLQSSNSGDTNTITVGRMGNIGPNVSDKALAHLIDESQSSLSIIQSDIYRHGIGEWDRFQSFAFPHIIRAAARGVKVRLVLSNDRAKIGFATINGDREYKRLIDGLAEKLQENDHRLDKYTARATACQRIEVAPFRFSRYIDVWPSKHILQPGLHTKFLMVDDAAFYVGSHNLYPAQLVEFGNIVTDAKAASEIKDQYWSKVWAESSTVRMTCPK
ncbi:MAG: hypothetical protein H7249_17940 [Chitinophagaceae bacterium]|nr:hypothetical protein [Oligoflexus sp.]